MAAALAIEVTTNMDQRLMVCMGEVANPSSKVALGVLGSSVRQHNGEQGVESFSPIADPKPP